MASPTLSPPQTEPERPRDRRAAVIERRIVQTRRQLKLNDFATGLIALLAGTLGYLFLAALADHWLFSGGLGFWGRLLLFLVLLTGAGWFCFRALIPPLVHKVNPIYAAKTLEQARPSLKNSLINLLLLRSDDRATRANPLAERVLDGLQASTASELEHIPPEVAVDKSHLIRRGYVLVALFAVAAIYFVLSPKSLVPSFGRVLWPWARIAAPSRVHIDRIVPGDATVFQGRSVTVSATVEGLRADEEVLLLFSTNDGQIVDQAIPMSPGEGHRRFECQVPPGKAGLQQPILYHLVAGDCVTETFSLEMEVPPTIVVDSVRYRYPPYTGLPERIVNDTADIRGIEGTRISLEATANREIQWAGIELSDQTAGRLRMRTDGRHARGEFALKLGSNGEELQRWYQIRFAESETGENRENLDPVRHRIEVFADRPPTIRWDSAPPESATLPLDGVAELGLEAADPDFALSRVTVVVEREGRALAIPPLLDRTGSPEGYEGAFEATYRLEPEKLGLRVGDEIQYVAAAEDTRQPQRNRTETEPRWLTIAPPERMPDGSGQTGGSDSSGTTRTADSGQEEDGTQAPSDTGVSNESSKTEEPGEAEDPANQGGEASDPGEQGNAGEEASPAEQETGAEESGDDASSEKPGDQDGRDGSAGEEQESAEAKKREKPLDGDVNPGDVFEEVLKQREKELQEQGQDEPQDGAQSEDAQQTETPGSQADPKPGDESKPAENDQTGEASGKPQPGEPSENAQEHQGETDVPPNRTESEGPESGAEGSEASDDPQGQGGVPSAKPNDESQDQSPKTESDAGGGTPTGRPGKGETTDDQNVIDGGKATPEDLEHGQVESGERKPGQPQGGKDPEHSQNPQPGSPEAGESSPLPSQHPETQPSPTPVEPNQPNAKKPEGGPQAAPKHKPEALSPSSSKKQSKSENREPMEGEKSGAGGEGGGQESDREGLGNPGSTTPDDDGGQPGGEQGKGETGPGAGEQVPTEPSTGDQADQPGGSGQREGEPGGDPEGQRPQGNRDTPPGQPPNPTTDQPPGGPPGGIAQRPDAAQPRSRAPGGTGEATGQSAASQPPQSQAANKEYAEKATELALEYLEDQLNDAEPNQELLDRLGWTRQDLERFVRRWQKMKAAAKEPGDSGETAQQELDDALKSLGLRPTGTAIEGGEVKSDSIGKIESIRSIPPPAWRELTQEYTKSIAAGDE